MSLLAAIRRGPIARLWGALALTAIGDEIYRVALIWLAVREVGAAASYFSALQASVLMVVSAVGGRLTDSRDPRGVMLAASLGRATVVLAPVAAWLAGGGMLWGLALAAVGLAAMRAQFDPAVQASLPRLSADLPELVAANGLLDGTQRLARVIGPSLAAALALVLAVEELFVATALVLLAAAALLVGLPRLPVTAVAGASARGVRAAAEFVLRHRVLGTMISLSAVFWGTWVIAIPLGLALVVAERHPTWLGIAEIGAYGFLIASYGASNVAANLLVAWRGARPGFDLVYGGQALLGTGIVAIGAAALWASDAWLLPALALAAFIAALGSPAHDIRLATEIQTAVESGSVASVFRVRMVSAWAAVLAASLAGPALFGWFGAGTAILAMGTIMVVAAAVGWLALRGR